MNQKKNRIIIIIAIILCVLILALGSAYLYVSTDILKSDKKVFMKYAMQSFDIKKGFINSDVLEYFKKQNNTPFEINGDISFKAFSPEIDDEEQINKCKIEFSGQMDLSNSKILQNININYAEDVKFPFVFEKNNNIVAIQTDYIGKKFIGLELDKLSQINEGFKDINLEIEKNKITGEQLEYIKSTYFNIIKEKLKDDSFSKIIEDDLNGYKLSLKVEELKQIVIDLLEETKNNQAVLDIINQVYEIKEKDINEIINELNSAEIDNNENIDILFFVNNNRIQKVRITNSTVKLEIEKDETANTKQYNLDIEYSEDGETIKAYIIAKYSGLQSLQLITENYELGIEMPDRQYVYYINNEINFVEGTNIEELTNSNSIILNRLQEDQRNNLIEAITNRIADVNKLLMERLGVTEDKNPLIYVTPLSTMYSSKNVYTNDTTMQMSNEEVNEFNKKFEVYEDTNSPGATVKGLLTTILSHNELYNDEQGKQITEINFNGEEYECNEENIVLLKGEISTEDLYKVEFEKDENTGRIYRVIINKK